MPPHPIGAALLSAALASSIAWPASAQTAASAPPTTSEAAKRPDPMDPKVAVPAAHYRSALGAYRRNVEQPVGSWRDANDTAGRAGGWRAYAREANAPETPAATPATASKPGATPASPAATPSVAKPDGHGGHKH